MSNKVISCSCLVVESYADWNITYQFCYCCTVSQS